MDTQIINIIRMVDGSYAYHIRTLINGVWIERYEPLPQCA